MPLRQPRLSAGLPGANSPWYRILARHRLGVSVATISASMRWGSNSHPRLILLETPLASRGWYSPARRANGLRDARFGHWPARACSESEQVLQSELDLAHGRGRARHHSEVLTSSRVRHARSSRPRPDVQVGHLPVRVVESVKGLKAELADCGLPCTACGIACVLRRRIR